MLDNEPASIDRATAYSPNTRGAKEEAIAPAALTIISMLLAIGALGTLICNQPLRGVGVLPAAATPLARQTLVRCVGVLIVLNLFDLMCTLLAVRTGGLLELNPLAHDLTNHPLPLAILKLVSVAIACGVMLAFWRHRLAQLASWWGSALYAVLAIRWATYNSFFLY